MFVAAAACGDIVVMPGATDNVDGGAVSSVSSSSSSSSASSASSSSSGDVNPDGGGDAGEPLVVPPPTMTTDPSTGPFTNVVMVTLADAQPSATIYYTVDGSTPTAASTRFVAPFPFTTIGTTTIKAFARLEGFADSDVSAFVIVLVNDGSVITSPILHPFATTENDAFTVTITTVTADAAICVTTDGVTPTCTDGMCTGASSPYDAATGIPITSDGTTVQALSCHAGETNSAVAEDTYHLQVADVTATGTTTITLATKTPNAEIHVTTDGTTPACTTGAPTTSVAVSPGTTLKTIACRQGFQSSGVQTFSY